MSKVKAPKSKGIPSKHLHARTTFLYQAATYLTLQATINTNSILATTTTTTTSEAQEDFHGAGQSPLALQLGSDLQQVSRKAQLKLSVDLKHCLCKSCNTILIPGRTATKTVENNSKGCKKPWADVLVVGCNFCGGKKRFPIGARRQPSKSLRKNVDEDKSLGTTMEDVQQSDTAIQTATEVESSAG